MNVGRLWRLLLLLALLVVLFVLTACAVYMHPKRDEPSANGSVRVVCILARCIVRAVPDSSVTPRSNDP